MATRRAVRGAAAIVLATVSASAGAEGQGWVQLPNGDVGYVTNYTTSGGFGCGVDLSPEEGHCAVSGNSLTISIPGGAAMTLAFLGVSRSITARNFGQIVDIGVFHKTVSGNFLFPRTSNINLELFTFHLRLDVTAPTVDSRTIHAGYRRLSPTRMPYNCCDGYGTDMVFPTAPVTTTFGYPLLIYQDFDFPTFTIDEDPVSIQAVVGLAPEPTTVSLLALGLLATVGIGLRRRA